MLIIEGCLFFSFNFSFLLLVACDSNASFFVSSSNKRCTTGNASSSNQHGRS